MQETSTTRGQRITLWFIAILMLVGTVGSFAMMVIANENDQKDQAKANEMKAAYQAEYQDYQDKLGVQAKQLSDKHYSQFSKYSSNVKAFDKNSVKELSKKDLLVGKGEKITSESSFYAYYIGWNPEGTIFDQSIEGDSLKMPYEVTPGMVIQGWTEGVDGMRVGGVRELTIPSDLAYGESGSGDNIPPNTPLKFIIMIIPSPEKIEEPSMSDELIRYYETGRV